QVNLNDIDRAGLPTVALRCRIALLWPSEIQFHGFAGHVERTRVSTFGDLNDVTCFLVDGHCFAFYPIRPENNPFPVGCPLGMGGIHLRVAAWLAGEEY